MRTKSLVLACVVGLAASACAHAKVPDENFAPDQTIAAAEERNVEDHPQAKLHLKLARDQVKEAQRLTEEGDEKEAKLMMLRAQADADYALALLRNADQTKETESIRKKLEQLRKEMSTTPTEQ